MTAEIISTALESIRLEIEEKKHLEEAEAPLLKAEETCGHVLAWDPEKGALFVRLETEGTDQFERMEGIERVHENDPVQLQDSGDGSGIAAYSGQRCLGTLPEKTGSALSLLEKEGLLAVEQAMVYRLIPVSRRGRYAKRAIVFIDLHAVIKEMKQGE